jgi:hypothetical protein
MSVAPNHRSIIAMVKRNPRLSVAFFLLIAALAGVSILNWCRGQIVPRLAQQLRAQGQPVDAADMAKLASSLPDQENFCIPLLEIAASIDADPRAGKAPSILPFFGTAPGPRCNGEPYTPEQIAEMQAFISDHADELRRIASSFDTLQEGALTVHWLADAPEFMWPSGHVVFNASKLLRLAALDADVRGDETAAEGWISRSIRLSNAFGREQLDSGLIQQSGIQAAVFDMVETCLNMGEYSTALVRKMRNELTIEPRRTALRDAFVADRVLILMNHPVMTDRRPGQWTVEKPEEWPITISFYKEAERARCVVLLTQLMDAALLERGAPAIKGAENIAKSIAQRAAWYSTMPRFAEVFVWTFKMDAGREARRRAICALLACEEYRLKHGGWPPSLSELVPEFLPQVPEDPFDQKPIRYARSLQGIKVWSVDTDMKDDGGDVAHQRINQSTRPADRGYALLRPDLRGKTAPSN